MKALHRQLGAATLAIALAVTLAACGGSNSNNSGSGGNSGGGGTPPTANTMPITAGPTATGASYTYTNGLYVTVRICAPGSTTDCQNIPDVLVDTGSYGLRLLANQVTVSLTESADSSNQPIGECAQFASSYSWGPIAKADVVLGGETASSVPIQLIGASGFPAPPSSCTSGLSSANTQTELGANGVLGIGVFRYDCGSSCSSVSPASVYFSCPNSGCTGAASVALTDQVQNPVALFATDNNGVSITLPSIADAGAGSTAGTLTFGIGTQSNNQLGSATVLEATPYDGTVATQYPTSNGNLYCTNAGYVGANCLSGSSGTVFDTGSNANFFLSSSTLTAMPTCANYTGFYCPASTTAFTATNGSLVSGNSKAATWNAANTDTLFAGTNVTFNNLAGPNPGAFDFGLPFFFGKTVFIGINGTTAGSYSGPFFAY